jgi:hypothetical protein
MGEAYLASRLQKERVEYVVQLKRGYTFPPPHIHKYNVPTGEDPQPQPLSTLSPVLPHNAGNNQPPNNYSTPPECLALGNGLLS